MTFDSRWKNPQGSDPRQLYLWAQDLIKELRRGDYLPATPDASDIAYSNTTSGLTATDVQAAIDENDARLDDLEALSIAALLPKFYAKIAVAGGVPSLVASFNVSGITDDATGLVTISFTTPFADADWIPMALCARGLGDTERVIGVIAQAAGSVQIESTNANNIAVDPDAYYVIGFGDQ